MSWKTLIDVQTVAENLSSEKMRILDCRFSLDDADAGRRAYENGHIPGALYVHLDYDLAGEAIPGVTGRHPLPSVTDMVRRISEWGIDASVQVVAYDDSGGAIAARAWWLLKWLGHESVAILDGGFSAWRKNKLSVDTDITQVKCRQFAADVQDQLVVDAAFVDAIKLDPAYCLIDSRSTERYHGYEEPIDPVAGHIPGAVNRPYADNLDDAGFFKPADQLKNRFLCVAGKSRAEDTVFYCGSGVTACHNIAAFLHAGLGMPKLYVGAWSDWITDSGRAVAVDHTL